jgi:hypothetical protein
MTGRANWFHNDIDPFETILFFPALMSERPELVFTFTDIFKDFALQHEIQGRGFTALYQNFLETQVATIGIRYRF